jgi:hypothetical protein
LTDDFADYFNQIPLAPSQYRAPCFAWSFSALGPQVPLQGFAEPLSVVSEKFLSLSVSLFLNFAQRFSEAIISVFRRLFDAEEAILFDKILVSSSGVCVPCNFRDLLTLDTTTG